MNRRQFAAAASGLFAASHWRGFAATAAPSTGKVRFSCMLWALEGKAPFEQCVDWVAAAGYQGVELVGEFQKWSAQQRTAAMRRMRAAGMVFDAMSGVKAGFAVPDETPAFKSQFLAHLDAARALECSRVILLSGPRVASLDPLAQRQVAVDNLKWAADTAGKLQVDIVIEPIDLLENPDIFLASVTDGFAIARAVDNPHLQVLYDFYHEQRSFGNLMEKLEKNIDLVGLVHVADVPGRHEPGTGEIDYGSIYRRLAALHYSRWIAMEYYPTGDPVASLRRARVEAQAAMGQG